MKKIHSFVFIICIIFNAQVFASNTLTLSQEIIQKTKHGVVSVSNNVRKATYSRIYNKKASAFLIDKKLGIWVTNSHVADDSIINNITLTTFNGRELEAKFLYNDPHKDFAFLKTEPKNIPEDLVELKLNDYELQTYQPVFLISNNEGKDFSIQTGNVVSQYQSVGDFPAQTISISLNTRGGSSGSPVLDYEGNVVALNFAGHETYADALKIAYVTEALSFIQQNKTPLRQTLDAFTTYYSLDKATKYQNFPKKLVTEYLAKYPDALNKALIVTQIQSHNDDSQIKTGDIIWQVNGQDIGPHMYKMDHLLNQSKGPVQVKVYRNGEAKNISVKPKNINTHKINRMVIFGGAVFYEVNEEVNLITGAPLGALSVTNIDDGGAFDRLPVIYGLSQEFGYFNGLRMINILGFNGKNISSLDELIKTIPKLVKQKYFVVNFQNFFFDIGMNNMQVLNRNPSIRTIEYESYASEPVELRFNTKSLDWDTKKIL